MTTHVYSTDGVAAEKLHGFFEGWPDPPPPKTHLEILNGSDHVVLALDDETGCVIGFITAISDGVLSAYIPLLEVLPEYRGRGVGSELVRRMLRSLDGFYMVDIVCDPELRPYYERFGMSCGAGMMLRDIARQSGR